MIRQYLGQKAAPWVSGFVLVGGLAIACMLVFLQKVTLQAADDFSVPTDEVGYHWTPPFSSKN